MRPPDENQANPTEPQLRPNLLSSARRGGNEDSILAKLEREPARRADADSGARLVWYGSAIVLALGLTVTLAWLAAGQGDSERALAAAHADMAPLALPAEVAVEAAEAPAAPMDKAVIVDAPPPPMLPAALQPAPANQAPVTIAEVRQPPAAMPLRLLKPAGSQPGPVKATPARPTARVAAERSGVAAAAPPRARPAAPRKPARQANTAPVRPGETVNDSDVALISAVIYHANGHAVAEPDAAPDACADNACRAHPAR